MVLIVASVVVRPFGEVIAGSYELVEVLIVVIVGFALAYTALKQRHVAISLLTSRFSQRKQVIIASFTWFLSLCTWGIIVWASTDIMFEKWLAERTEWLGVPYLPFRFVWVFGLLLYCLVFLIELSRALKQAAGK